jgi:hypothetical protein
MSTKAFSFMLLILVIVGGTIGGALFAFTGEDTEGTPVAAVLPTPTLAPDNAIAGESIVTDDGARLRGSRQGLSVEPIRGILASISATGLVITSTDTGANTEVIVPPQTPVSLSEAADDTSSITPGAEVVAFLQRTVDGTITATSITIGGFGSRAAGFGGLGGRGGTTGGGTAADGAEFNAVTGIVTSYASGILDLETTDGSINVTVANDTAIRLTIAFANLTDQLDIGSEITVIGRRDDTGSYSPITITAGALGGFGGAAGGRFIVPSQLLDEMARLGIRPRGDMLPLP